MSYIHDCLYDLNGITLRCCPAEDTGLKTGDRFAYDFDQTTRQFLVSVWNEEKQEWIRLGEPLASPLL